MSDNNITCDCGAATEGKWKDKHTVGCAALEADQWIVFVPIHPTLGPYWPSMKIGDKEPKENFVEGYVWTRCILRRADHEE